jgi:hypothetical protein
MRMQKVLTFRFANLFFRLFLLNRVGPVINFHEIYKVDMLWKMTEMIVQYYLLLTNGFQPIAQCSVLDKIVREYS